MLCIVAVNSISPASSAGVIASTAGLPRAFLMAASRFLSGKAIVSGAVGAGVGLGIGVGAGLFMPSGCRAQPTARRAIKLKIITPIDNIALNISIHLSQIVSHII